MLPAPTWKLLILFIIFCVVYRVGISWAFTNLIFTCVGKKKTTEKVEKRKRREKRKEKVKHDETERKTR